MLLINYIKVSNGWIYRHNHRQSRLPHSQQAQEMGENGPTVIISISPQLKMGKITINSPWNGRGGKGRGSPGSPVAGHAIMMMRRAFQMQGERLHTRSTEAFSPSSLQNNKFLLVAGMATSFLSVFVLHSSLVQEIVWIWKADLTRDSSKCIYIFNLCGSVRATVGLRLQRGRGLLLRRGVLEGSRNRISLSKFMAATEMHARLFIERRTMCFSKVQHIN